MSNQAHDRPMEDPAKKRREYVIGKIAISLHISTGHTLMLISFVLLTLLTLLPALLQSFGPDIQRLGIPIYRVSLREWPTFVVFIFLICMFFGGKAISYKGKRDASYLEYVAPVHEQIATLPAEAVLLRGSDQSTATPDELLRAARAGAETEVGGAAAGTFRRVTDYCVSN